MAMPMVAPMEDEANEPAGEMDAVNVKCAAAQCMFNHNGECEAGNISVSPDAKCLTFKVGPKVTPGGAGAPAGGLPRPPLPMPGMMGNAG